MATPTIEKRHSSRIERLAVKVWGYVRDNARSLDSERHRAAVEQIVRDDIAWHDERLEETRRKLAVAEASIEVLMRKPPPMPKAGEWNKAKKMNAARAVWAVEYAAGRGVPYPVLAKALGSEVRTIGKILAGEIWAEETEKVRAKYDR